MNENMTNYDRQYLAISSVPMQWADWSKVYEPDTALEAGTLFPELNLPFLGYKERWVKK
jgi:hypothetical protein